MRVAFDFDIYSKAVFAQRQGGNKVRAQEPVHVLDFTKYAFFPQTVYSRLHGRKGQFHHHQHKQTSSSESYTPFNSNKYGRKMDYWRMSD